MQLQLQLCFRIIWIPRYFNLRLKSDILKVMYSLSKFSYEIFSKFSSRFRERERERESKKPKSLFLLKSIFSLLIFVCLFLITSKGVQAATYYVRADGTVLAASKASATSPNSASTSLNMTQVNAATFSAGDQILFSSQGGSYATSFVLPSGGSGVGTEITYANVTSETPTIS